MKLKDKIKSMMIALIMYLIFMIIIYGIILIIPNRWLNTEFGMMWNVVLFLGVMPYLILSELVMPLYVFFINKKSEVKIK